MVKKIENHAEKVKALTGMELPQIEKTKEEKKKEEEKRILCILGTAGSRYKAPWNDKRCTFWGVAHCLLLEDIKKLDKVFEIHLPYTHSNETSPFSGKPIIMHANKEHRLFGGEGDLPVVLAQPDDSVNNYEIFDREGIKKKYGDLLPVSDAFYATNSIAWMIIQGIEEGFDEIHLYGIHLETDSEWQFERPCNEYWLGVFTGIMLERGIKGVVHMPEESDVLRCSHEYGYAEIEVKRKKYNGRKEFFSKNIADMQNKRTQLMMQINKLNQERQMTLEQKKEALETQIDQMQKELDIIKNTKSDDYMRNISNQINEQLRVRDSEIRMIDSRMSAFNGAKEELEYHLKELNA